MLTVCVCWSRPADKQFNFEDDTWNSALHNKHGKRHGSEPTRKFTAALDGSRRYQARIQLAANALSCLACRSTQSCLSMAGNCGSIEQSAHKQASCCMKIPLSYWPPSAPAALCFVLSNVRMLDC